MPEISDILVPGTIFPATKISEILVALGNLAVLKFRKVWWLERDTLPVIKFPKFSVGRPAAIKFPKFLRHARGNKVSEIFETCSR